MIRIAFREDLSLPCVDEQRNIWVGTNKGLSIFNPATEKFTTFRHIPGDENSLLSNQVLDIKQMRMDGCGSAPIWVVSVYSICNRMHLLHQPIYIFRIYLLPMMCTACRDLMPDVLFKIASGISGWELLGRSRFYKLCTAHF